MMKIFAIPAMVGIASAAAIRRENVLCASNGGSTAPEPPVDTLSGFNEYYGELASKVSVPVGYQAVMTNANCALSASNKYMTYVRMESYDAQVCANICSTHAGCDAFNIYVQRDPAVVPGPNCPNPASIFTANCALYSEPVAESACTNFGQHIGPVDANGEAFKIAIRGSNAYAKLPTREIIKTVTTTKYVQGAIEPRTEAAAITQAPRPLAPRQQDVNYNGATTAFEVTRVGQHSVHIWNGQTLEFPSTFNRTVGWMDDATRPANNGGGQRPSTFIFHPPQPTSTRFVYPPTNTVTVWSTPTITVTSTPIITVYETAAVPVEKTIETTPAPNNGSGPKTITLDDNYSYWDPKVKLSSGVKTVILNTEPTLPAVQKIATTPAPEATNVYKTLAFDENFTETWDQNIPLPSGVRTLTLHARETPQ